MEFELLKEDEHAFHIKHPDGSHFPIAKAGLDDEIEEKIRKMKPLKMADGGVVPGVDDGSSSSIQSPDSEQKIVSDAMAAPAQATPSDAGSPNFTNGTFDFKKWALNSPDAPISAKTDALKAMNDSAAQADASKAADSANKTQEIAAYNEQASKAGLPTLPVPGSPQRSPNGEMPAPMGAAPQPQQPGAPAPQEKPGAFGLPGMYGQAFADQAKGIKGVADAKTQEAQDTAAAYQNYMKGMPAQDQLQKQVADLEQRKQDILKQSDDLYQKVVNGQVDPHHFWANKSTGSKVMATIGVILGGIGSGLTGQPNAALGLIQKQMDQDIDAQKTNLDKNNSLLRINMQRYGDLNQAEAATRLQMNQVLQGQIATAAAKSGSQQAQSQGLMLMGQLKQQAAGYAHQLAVWQVQGASLGAGSGQGGLPVGREPLEMLNDPKYQAKRVVVNGTAYQASSDKEGEEVRQMQSNYTPIMNGIKMLDQLGPSATVKGTEDYNKAQSIRNALVFKVNELYNMKRLSGEDKESILQEIDDPTSFSQMMKRGVRNSTFTKILNSSMDSAYSSKLMGYRGMDSISSRKPGWK